MLLWALQNKVTLNQIGGVQGRNPKPLEEWYLGDYARVAHELGLIGASAKTAVDQAHAFRNLIHPGRAQRLRTACNRSTAHLGLGALYSVIEDLRKL
jgi:hypothetical protein